MKTFKMIFNLTLISCFVLITNLIYADTTHIVPGGVFAPTVTVSTSDPKAIPGWDPNLFIADAEQQKEANVPWKTAFPGLTFDDYFSFPHAEPLIIRLVNQKGGTGTYASTSSSGTGAVSPSTSMPISNTSNGDGVSLTLGGGEGTTSARIQTISTVMQKQCPMNIADACTILKGIVEPNFQAVTLSDEENVFTYKFYVKQGVSQAVVADALKQINALHPQSTMHGGGSVIISEPISREDINIQKALSGDDSYLYAFLEPEGFASILPSDPFVSSGSGYAEDADGYAYVAPYKIVEADNTFDPVVVDPNATAILALFDTGVDYDHPDLMNRIAFTQKEIPNNVKLAADTNGNGDVTMPELLAYFAISKPSQLFSPDIKSQWADGKDGDGNGYVDDLIGWDFVSSDNNPFDEAMTTDLQSHGTNMAGIIAAQANNGQGIAGLASSNTLFRPYRLIRPDGTLRNMDVVLALKSISRSNEMANKINTISIGANLIQDPGLVFQIKSSKLGNPKLVIVVPEGNSGVVMLRSISASHNVIGVGATDIFNQVEPYSNKSPGLLVVAPGDHQLSSYSTNPAVPPSDFLQDPKYKYSATGTSVSGAIASSLPSIMRKRVHELEQILGVNTGWRSAHDTIWMMLGATAISSDLSNTSSASGQINFADSVAAAEKFVQIVAANPSGIQAVKETRAYSVACTISGNQVTINFSQQALVNPNANIPIGVDFYNPQYEVLFGDAWAPLFLDEINVQTPWRMFVTDGVTDPITFTSIPLPQKARFTVNLYNYAFEELQPTNQMIEVECK